MQARDSKGSVLHIALVGNPNVGKSVIFGHLTGRYANVANYPGTTVEIAQGTWTIPGHKVTLMDTPGVNSLIPLSEEERVTRDILLHGDIEAVVQVADAKNIRRALLITLELAEMEIPFLLDLNMEDEAEAAGITLHKERLSSLLGVPVVGTIAIERRGLQELTERIFDLTPSSYKPSYSPKIEKAILKMDPFLPKTRLSSRSIAVMILSRDASLRTWLQKQISSEDWHAIERVCADLENEMGGEASSSILHQERLKIVDHLLVSILRKQSLLKRDWASKFGSMAMHPVGGIVVLAGVLFLFYKFVGHFGAQICVDWFENVLFGKYINPWAVRSAAKLFFFSPFLQDLLVGPYGVVTMALTYAFAIIFPIVVTFFIAFSLIEDSGYLPRLSIMLNSLFRFIGLNGKAVVPMILGLGCDTMATMSARIMDTQKEKIILTLLLALAVPCSAQLGIILGMLATMPFQSTLIWGSVIGVTLLAVGFLSAQILPGAPSDFILEIPPIRRPVFFNIVTKTMARLEWYLREVVPLFVLGTLILFFLDRLQWLPRIQKFAEPLVVRVLGLPPEAAEAFLIGFLRRDYGATRFFDMYGDGRLTVAQATVALIVITLFVPCLANTFMIVKERGIRVAVAMMAFIYPLAFLIGGIIRWGFFSL